MCIDPATAAIIMTVASAGVQAAGAISEGNDAAALADAQAANLDAQAAAEAKTSGYQITREYERQRLEQAQAQAQVGASGVALTGSPAAVLAENAAQGQLDIEAIRYGSNLRQNQLRTQGQITRQQGDAAKKGGLFKAAGSIFSAASSAFGMSAGNSVKVGQSPFAPSAHRLY